jgi:hypothetical protein
MRWITRRRAAGALAGLAFAVAGMAVFGAPAGLASAQPGITIASGQTVERDYPGLNGSVPSAQADSSQTTGITPDDCRVQTWCDVVPLTLQRPSHLDVNDEFFVRIILSYEQTKPDGSTPTNELDLYVWDDPQGAKPVTQSVSSTQPISATLFQPPKDKYQVVVVSSYGPSTGYHLKLSAVVDRVAPPVDASKANKTTATTVATAAAPTPAPATATPTARTPVAIAPSSAAAPIAPAVDTTPLPLDNQLAGAATINPLAEDQPTPSQLAAARTKPIPPPKPASRVALLGWLVAVPVGLLIAERRLLFGRRLRGTVPLRG